MSELFGRAGIFLKTQRANWFFVLSGTGPRLCFCRDRSVGVHFHNKVKHWLKCTSGIESLDALCRTMYAKMFWQRCFDFWHTWTYLCLFSTGFNQALNLTKTQAFDGLPAAITDGIGNVDIPNVVSITVLVLSISQRDTGIDRRSMYRHPSSAGSQWKQTQNETMSGNS